MPLMCRFKVDELEIKGDWWLSREEFNELGSDYVRDVLIPEDYLNFIEDIDLLKHVEFYWKD